MKAWRVGETASDLSLDDVTIPQPGPGQLLIRVHAAGATPTELQWYPTSHLKTGEARRHAVPGHEFSGVVAAIGPGAEGTIGQAVFGMNDWFDNGATAEFCCTVPTAVALKPNGLSHAQAATVPIGALTAWQGLFDRARLQSGERVLIHGGSGAVGVFAIQFAHSCGAHVLTTASPRNWEFLLQLGAQRVIDYHTERFEDVAQGVDVIFDAVGGETLQRSWGILGPGGRLVTIASHSETASDERTKQAFFIVEPNRQQLSEIAARLDSGRLRAVVDRIVPFDQASTTYLPRASETRGRGKTVIEVLPPE